MTKFSSIYFGTIVAIAALTGCQANNSPVERGGQTVIGGELIPRTDSDQCNDSNVCTLDQVDVTTKLCTYVVIAGCCSAETPCASGQVCGSDNKCAPIDCDDGDLCTDDKLVGNECVHTPVTVDDGKVCTADSCTSAGGVKHDAIAGCCETSDDCPASQLCTPSNTCQGVPCATDDNVCTTDAVVNHVCTHTAIAGCCTADTECFAMGETSWGYVAPCGGVDHNVCNVGQQCFGGAMCLPLAYKFGCTVDPVDSPELFTNGVATVGGTCEMCADSNGNGTCANHETFCTGGLDEDADGDVDCDDTDCAADPACDPSNACTGDADCDDGDPCTTDTCSVSSFCTHAVIAGCVACTTVAECTAGQVCDLGVCKDSPAQNLCADQTCGATQVCDAGQCLDAGTAIWCWDDGHPPSCETHGSGYFSPDLWRFKDHTVAPPACQGPSGGQVFLPLPACCVSDDAQFTRCISGGWSGNPY